MAPAAAPTGLAPVGADPDSIKVTVSDPVTGEVLGETILDNDYVIVCAGNRYVSSTNAHANGTHVITVKREKS